MPATSANLGPGFDSLALALGQYDEVAMAVAPSGLDVQVAGEGSATLSRDERHLVVHAARATFDRLGCQPPGLVVRCSNGIPQGRGLGSSAAAIVAGVVAARTLSGSGGDLDEGATLELCAELEGHPDNVAACLLGGLIVVWTEDGRTEAARLPVALEDVVAWVPPFQASTVAVRSLLPESVPHADAAANAGRAALLVEALGRRIDLLLPATADRLHQPYRASAMPASAAFVAELRARGIAAVISGAGPTVLGIGPGAHHGVPPAEWQVLRLAVDRAGATVIERE